MQKWWGKNQRKLSTNSFKKWWLCLIFRNIYSGILCMSNFFKVSKSYWKSFTSSHFYYCLFQAWRDELIFSSVGSRAAPTDGIFLIKHACYWMPPLLLHRATNFFLQALWIVTQESDHLWNFFQNLASLPLSLQRHPTFLLGAGGAGNLWF